jgi:hypothetical protein
MKTSREGTMHDNLQNALVQILEAESSEELQKRSSNTCYSIVLCWVLFSAAHASYPMLPFKAT